MTSAPARSVAVVIAAIAVLLGAIVQLQRVRERAFPLPTMDEETLYVTSGQTLRRAMVSYRLLAADLYWIRSLQYYGGTRRTAAARAAEDAMVPPALAAPDERYSLLYPLLDVTTTLDPRFNIAYRFGAIFLAEPPPGGPGRPDLAIRLLEKGIRERPDRWQYMQDMGFVYYWWLHDYRTAASWFDRAAAVPGAPWWLKSLAAYTLIEGGDRRSSRTMWLAIRQSAEDEWLKHDADRRLAQLDALDQIEALQKAVDRYAARAFSTPADWATLVRAGVLSRIPVDPTGTPYDLADGRVRIARHSSLFPMPAEPPSTNEAAK